MECACYRVFNKARCMTVGVFLQILSNAKNDVMIFFARLAHSFAVIFEVEVDAYSEKSSTKFQRVAPPDASVITV